MRTLQDAIRRLAKDDTVAGITIGRVTAVDADARTVDVQPLDGEAPLLGLNLQANQTGTVGLVQFPRIDSCVIVGTFTNYGGAGAVLLCEDVERIEAAVGNYTLEITDEGITLNDGNLGGLVKIQELQQNLNTIKMYCEQLSNAVQTGLTAVGVGTAANGGTGASAFQAAMSGQSITFQDMENQSVKQ